MKTLHWLIAGTLGLGLAACNDGSDDSPTCAGVTLDAGGSTYCASLITETGFLCPASLPDAFDFDGFTVCVPEGETPSDELVAALCEELESDGYSLDADTGECLDPDNEPVVPVAVGSRQPDAGEADADQPDVGEPDVDLDAGPFDAGRPDGDAGQIDSGPVDAGREDTSGADARPTDTSPSDASTLDIGVGEDAGTAGAECVSSEPGDCAAGFYCAQQEPAECLPSFFVGVCTAVPPESEWDTPFEVCGCDGQVFPSGEGAARAAGYGGPIVACEFNGVCPDYALACPSECFDMSAARYDATNGCLVGTGGSSVVGCTSIEGGTDDTPCVKRLQDGALFVATSGTPFNASMQWVACSEEEERAVAAARPCGR